MLLTLPPHTRLVQVLLQRAEGLAKRFEPRRHWEFQLSVAATKQGKLLLHYTLSVLNETVPEVRVRDHVCSASLIITDSVVDTEPTGLVVLELHRYNGRTYGHQLDFDYAVRDDLLQQAAERLTHMIGEFFHDGEVAFLGMDFYLTNDNNRDVYLKRVGGMSKEYPHDRSGFS